MKSTRQTKSVVVFCLLACCALASSEAGGAQEQPFPATSDAGDSGGNVAGSGEQTAQQTTDAFSPLPEKDPLPMPSFAVDADSDSDPQQQEQSLSLRQAPQANYGGQAPKALQLIQAPNQIPGSTRLNAVALHRQDSDLIVSTDVDGDDIRTTRPSAAAGVPDEVTFAMFAKTFLGANMKDNNFDLDFILLLKWKDARVADMVPAGLDQITMSGEQAEKKIWMPGVVVTNRAINQYEVISTVVMIYKTGEITKVERSSVTCMNIFELQQYPFDIQALRVKIASAKYMLDELVLKPNEDKSQSGVNEGIMDAFQYTVDDWKIYAFEETDGAMAKSRGVLQIDAKRSLDKYGESHLMPTALVMVISWAVFWFPFQTPFVTPRMALSILALLSFTNLMIKSSSALPGGAPCNWNDNFNQMVLALMCTTILINIMSEICFHQIKLPELGIAINNEAKILQPMHSITILTIVESGGMYKWISVGNAQVVVKVIFGLVFSGYIMYSLSRISSFKAEKERKEYEEAQKKLMEEPQKMPPAGP